MDNLAKDAAAALKAGMSYGRWKAMQDPVVIERKIPDGWQVCRCCGKPFKPKKRGTQKYCDNYCMRRVVNERYRKRSKERERKK